MLFGVKIPGCIVGGTVGGIAGACTANATLAGVSSVSPSVLVARTANEWKPLLSAVSGWNGVLQPAHAPPSSWHSKVAPVASEVNENVGRVLVVTVPGQSVIVVSGATGAGGVGVGGGGVGVKVPLSAVVPVSWW